MDHSDENATGLFRDHMPLFPAAYFNNMCNLELYGWVIFERHGQVPVLDPENLSDEFKARANAINIGHLPAGDPTTWVLPADTQKLKLKRLKNVVREQIDCYDRLKKEGCLPWYDRSQIQHAVYNTKDQPNITELWRGKYDNGSRVLSKQLVLWNKFRSWQSWRRKKAEIMILNGESLGRLVKPELRKHLSLFKLEQNQEVQTEATTLLEYLDFIDRYYASSKALVESCKEALDQDCTCEQDFSPKRERHLTRKRKRRATGTSKGRACEGKCKEGAVANLENAKRTLQLRDAIWRRTVKQLKECKRDGVESVYPESPLESRNGDSD